MEASLGRGAGSDAAIFYTIGLAGSTDCCQSGGLVGAPLAPVTRHGLFGTSDSTRLPMIPRYARPDMAAIWEPQTRFRIWFEIEAHAADALAELGVVPKEAAKAIWAKGKDATFDIARIDEIEREVKHDVIAFLTHLAEIVGPEARFVHQ